MDKTRRLAEIAIEKYPQAFSDDYEQNKKALEELTVIPSKQLRNHLAGYIAKSLKAKAEPEAPEEPQAE